VRPRRDAGAIAPVVRPLARTAAGVEHVYRLVVGRHGIAPIEAIGTDVIGAVADW
jgi:hypothetical protein